MLLTLPPDAIVVPMIEINDATTEDIDDLIELESALFEEDGAQHDPYADPTWPRREGRQDFEDLIGADDCILLVAHLNGDPVGFLAGYSAPSSPTRKPVTYAVLRSLYVAEAARRSGAATLLTERFLDLGPGNKTASKPTSTTTPPTPVPVASTTGSASNLEVLLEPYHCWVTSPPGAPLPEVIRRTFETSSTAPASTSTPGAALHQRFSTSSVSLPEFEGSLVTWQPDHEGSGVWQWHRAVLDQPPHPSIGVCNPHRPFARHGRRRRSPSQGQRLQKGAGPGLRRTRATLRRPVVRRGDRQPHALPRARPRPSHRRTGPRLASRRTATGSHQRTRPHGRDERMPSPTCSAPLHTTCTRCLASTPARPASVGGSRRSHGTPSRTILRLSILTPLWPTASRFPRATPPPRPKPPSSGKRSNGDLSNGRFRIKTRSGAFVCSRPKS